MKVWLIWMQIDETTWLEAAWDDDATADNRSGWEVEVDRCRKMAVDGKGEMRIQAVEVPGVFDLFTLPTVKATVL